MLEHVVCGEQTLPAWTSRSSHSSFSIVQPLSGISRMVTLICHDLRHPLTAILANAEFLVQSDLSEKERTEFYQEIRSAIDRMDELVSSLFEYSRDGDILRPAAQSVVDTVDRAIRMTSVRREFRRIAIEHHHQGVAVGWFDSTRLERVITNLLLNACEAVSPDSGHIVIATTGNQAYLQVSVWDNGPGIPPTIRDSVFQPFVSHGKAEGSGLGLAIAKKLVEDHGGKIYLDGSGESGTLFRISIPFAIPHGAIPLGCKSKSLNTRIRSHSQAKCESPKRKRA